MVNYFYQAFVKSPYDLVPKNMEADESIDVLGLPERNAYGSLVVADESEHSEEDIEVGDKKSTCKQTFIVFSA